MFINRPGSNPGFPWQNRISKYFTPYNHGYDMTLERALTSTSQSTVVPILLSEILPVRSNLVLQPPTQILEIYGNSQRINMPCSPYFLLICGMADAKEMLDCLEKNQYLKNEKIFQGYTPRQVLETLLEETVKNAVEVLTKRFKEQGYVGAEICVIAFLKGNELWIRILDNGDGFPEYIVPRLGLESASNRQDRLKDGFHFQESTKDHLFKMGQLAVLLNWKFIAKNREDTNGAEVSLVIPINND